MDEHGYYFPSANNYSVGKVVDVTNALGYPVVLNAIVDQLNTIIPSDVEGLVSATPKGTVLASTLASRHGYQHTTIKEEANGWANRIVGAMPSRDSNLVYIDTVFHEKTDFYNLHQFVVEPLNSYLDHAYVLQKEEEKDIGIPVTALFK